MALQGRRQAYSLNLSTPGLDASLCLLLCLWGAWRHLLPLSVRNRAPNRTQMLNKRPVGLSLPRNPVSPVLCLYPPFCAPPHPPFFPAWSRNEGPDRASREPLPRGPSSPWQILADPCTGWWWGLLCGQILSNDPVHPQRLLLAQ